MKKKLIISVIVAVVTVALLTVPIPLSPCKDGGTSEYIALTYKIVDWNRLTQDGVYSDLRIYFGSKRWMSIGELWEIEKSNAKKAFLATVTEINEENAVVEPLSCESEFALCKSITFNTKALEDISTVNGSLVEISYIGDISDSAQINAISWKIPQPSRDRQFTDFWMDVSSAETLEDCNDSYAIVTDVYSDCFFVGFPNQAPYKMKIKGNLPVGFCIGDAISFSYKNVYFDRSSNRAEAELVSAKPGGMHFDTSVVYKPVIYLYPEQDTEIYVGLDLNGEFVCTYPVYDNGWTVAASPNGTIRDAVGQIYNYLYWEADIVAQYDMTSGFCIRGEDTVEFLEVALHKLGLNRREANEFIVYWLPLMQNNPYNIISFQTSGYTDVAGLIIDPLPDTVIRVFMAWQASDVFVELQEQELTSSSREGFTVVEWGGTEIK